MVRPDCEKCGDKGYYMDAKCLTDECAHAGRAYSPAELKRMRAEEQADAKAEGRAVNLNLPKRETRVMVCPSRPCTCPASQPIRAKQKRDLARQSRRIAYVNN